MDAGGTIKFVGKLYQKRQPVRFVLIEGGIHGLRAPLRDEMLYEWLDKYVKTKSPLPAMTPHGD